MSLYIITQTPYCGDAYCFEYKNIDQRQIEEAIYDACTRAFEKYEQLVENTDVPASILYQSISILELSSTRPTVPCYIYLNDCAI